jgi:ribonuclease BN (tRNA processing enzyme)
VAKGQYLSEILEASEGHLVFCFAGVGSAFAKRNDQTSLIIAKDRKTILVDAGVTIPQSFYRHGMDTTDFDYYHVTHAHADHAGGLEEILLKYRYMVRRKPKFIITPQFQHSLWENTLKGGAEVNELNLLKFTDLVEIIEPTWLKHQPRETYHINIDGIDLTIFRTIHTPGNVTHWEKAAWSTGLIVDGRIMFTADTRYDPNLFIDFNMNGIDTLFHDCQLFSPGIVHASYQELKALTPEIRSKTYLTHYGDNFDQFDPILDGFKGFARAFQMYRWKV